VRQEAVGVKGREWNLTVITGATLPTLGLVTTQSKPQKQEKCRTPSPSHGTYKRDHARPRHPAFTVLTRHQSQAMKKKAVRISRLGKKEGA